MSNKRSPEPKHPPRWARNAELARYLNRTKMTVWRWQRDPELEFPQPTVINGISYTDLNEIDAWMKSLVVDRRLSVEPKEQEVA